MTDAPRRKSEDTASIPRDNNPFRARHLLPTHFAVDDSCHRPVAIARSFFVENRKTLMVPDKVGISHEFPVGFLDNLFPVAFGVGIVGIEYRRPCDLQRDFAIAAHVLEQQVFVFATLRFLGTVVRWGVVNAVRCDKATPNGHQHMRAETTKCHTVALSELMQRLQQHVRCDPRVIPDGCRMVTGGRWLFVVQWIEVVILPLSIVTMERQYTIRIEMLVVNGDRVFLEPIHGQGHRRVAQHESWILQNHVLQEHQISVRVDDVCLTLAEKRLAAILRVFIPCNDTAAVCVPFLRESDLIFSFPEWVEIVLVKWQPFACTVERAPHRSADERKYSPFVAGCLE